MSKNHTTDIIKRLEGFGMLSEELPNLGHVPTGSYAMNRVISGNYTEGIPLGMMTQFYGESSTAKTVFVTHILKEAQAKGYWTLLLDSEFSYDKEFAEALGIDVDKLHYHSPQTVEDCFETMEEYISKVRAQDTDTPIVIGYDSIAVSPIRTEAESEDYQGHNMIGAMRAKKIGECLRKAYPLLREKNVALVVVNQIRHKVNIQYGSPETPAAGGKALPFYLGVAMTCSTKQNTDHIKNDRGLVIGISGKLKNKKNKVSKPFAECDFELIFDKGLDPFCGVVKLLVQDGHVEQNGAWYSVCETQAKFQSKNFKKLLLDPEQSGFDPIRKLLEISC